MSNDPTRPRVRVAVVNYNSGAYLHRSLHLLANQTFGDFEAVVVDNASSDDSLEGALPNDSRFKLIALPTNVGFAAGNNTAIAGASAEYIALLNPDAFPEPDWLANLVTAADNGPAYSMFGSTQLSGRWKDMADGLGDYYSFFGLAWRGGHGRQVSPPYPTHEVFGPCAAAALYRRSAFEEVGGFDQSYFCYMEDVDLAFRIRLSNGRCLQVGSAIVSHMSSIAHEGAGKDFVGYHIMRNLVWTFVKDMPGPLLAVGMPFHLAYLAFATIRHSFRGRGRSTLRGLRDAVRGLPAIWRERIRVQSARRASSLSIARALTWSVVQPGPRRDIPSPSQARRGNSVA